jgi:signal transduction histidine kinase
MLAGLLHDLNAPLNNLNLTLALLNGTIARIGVQPSDEPVLTRCRRYVDTLGIETHRLSEHARTMSAALDPQESTGVESVAALIGHAHHALRHHATLHEVHVTLAAAPAEVCTSGDIGLLRLALLALMLTSIGITAAGGGIVVTPEDAGDHLNVRIRASPAQASAAALRAADAILTPPGPQWRALVAARHILEMHGGSVTLHADAHDTVMLDAHLPLHLA